MILNNYAKQSLGQRFMSIHNQHIVDSLNRYYAAHPEARQSTPNPRRKNIPKTDEYYEALAEKMIPIIEAFCIKMAEQRMAIRRLFESDLR